MGTGGGRGGSVPQVKRPECEGSNLIPCSDETKNEWDHAFMTWSEIAVRLHSLFLSNFLELFRASSICCYQQTGKDYIRDILRKAQRFRGTKKLA